MAQVGKLWPHAPALSAADLALWRTAASINLDVWATALTRCQAQRRRSTNPDRARFRPDLIEILEMCRAIRGPYRRFNDTSCDGERGDITPKPEAVVKLRALKAMVR